LRGNLVNISTCAVLAPISTQSSKQLALVNLSLSLLFGSLCRGLAGSLQHCTCLARSQNVGKSPGPGRKTSKPRRGEARTSYRSLDHSKCGIEGAGSGGRDGRGVSDFMGLEVRKVNQTPSHETR
jgi:hypothetical protein